MSKKHFFTGRVGVIATMHHKEQVIGPLLEKELGITAIVPENFDTDRFGTFTRDVERLGNQIEAARHKALRALELTQESLGIASEGVFTSHPMLSFVPMNREIVLLLDKKNDLEVFGEAVSVDTCYHQKRVQSVEEAYEFALNSGFPEHAMVVMVSESTTKQEEIFKGITSKEQLNETVQLALKKSSDGYVHIENDLRAMHNPTRMKTIKKATENLVERLKLTCPTCHRPGYQITGQKRGLPCSICALPTNAIRSVIYACKACNHEEEKLYPNGQKKADPSVCPYRNP